MSNFKTIDEARAYFSGDRFATENGIRASCVVNVDVVDDTGRMIYRGRSDLEATEAVVTAIPDVGKKKRKR